jgi:DNA mismatch repair ATPase MutS
MAYELINLILFADAHIALALARCTVPNRDALLAGLSALAELDALCSLASFAAEQPRACYPVPDERTEMTIIDGCHPLVAPERAVPNDAHLTPTVRMWVITGSNMAGKSTFLRMVGTNVLLAQIGCVAVAREMRWSPLRLITDLRVRDNLAQDESYFLAEVRHLRRMVLPPAGDAPILGLIDEPFRGTNAQDQSAASVAILGRLLASSDLFLVATHDQHLTALADGAPARNYHFQEDLSGDVLVFDYRLREGPARTRNALRILEREGYPPELVRQAYAWVAEPPTATGHDKQGAS